MKFLNNRFTANMLRLSLLLLIISSCSSTQFLSQGKSNISLAKLKNPAVYDQFEISREFYLWGTIPKQQIIDVDSVLMQHHHLKMAEVAITQFRNSQDWFFAFMTLGLYVPVHYKLEFRGERYESDAL